MVHISSTKAEAENGVTEGTEGGQRYKQKILNTTNRPILTTVYNDVPAVLGQRVPSVEKGNHPHVEVVVLLVISDITALDSQSKETYPNLLTLWRHISNTQRKEGICGQEQHRDQHGG